VRLLNTLLAATYRKAGIQSLITTNPADFGVFASITPKSPATTPWQQHLANNPVGRKLVGIPTAWLRSNARQHAGERRAPTEMEPWS